MVAATLYYKKIEAELPTNNNLTTAFPNGGSNLFKVGDVMSWVSSNFIKFWHPMRLELTREGLPV